MATIVQAVHGFLREMEWHWEQLDEHRLRAMVSGDTCQWTWLAVWDEDDTGFASYSICPFQIPKNRRLAVAEYITLANYGLRVGNFELDFRDGEARYKTSVPLKKDKLTRSMVRELAFFGFNMMDRYLPGMMAVAFGKLSPRKAIEQAEHPAPAEPEGGETPEGPATPDEADGQALRGHLTARFAEYLRLMKNRRIDEAKSNCFIAFADHLHEAKATPRKKDAKSQPLPRMVQICFHEDWFAIDIPNTNIYPREAQRLLSERQGFYREAETPDAGVTDVVNVVEFDPVGKRYTYGQEQEAAEDAAWIFFDLWGLVPNQPLYVSASSFKTNHKWEQDELLK
jgi:hypothetical protein